MNDSATFIVFLKLRRTVLAAARSLSSEYAKCRLKRLEIKLENGKKEIDNKVKAERK